MHNSRRIHRIASSLSHGGAVGGTLYYHEQSHRSDCKASISDNNKNNDNVIDKESSVIVVNNKTNDDHKEIASSPLELNAYDELSMYDYFKETIPPTDNEIEAASQSLLDNDDNVFDRIVPGLGASIKKEAIKYIKTLDFNELAMKTRENLKNSSPSSPPSLVFPDSIDNNNSKVLDDKTVKVDNESDNKSISEDVSPTVFQNIGSQMVSWEKLHALYPCAICQDVLSAPVLIQPCSHSFCGNCMEEFWNIKKGDITQSASASASSSSSSSWSIMSNIFNFFNDDSDDEEDKITFTCPECREQILNKTGIFNKILDRDICKLVAEVKDCEAKREWQIRRNDYLNNKTK